MRQKAGFTLIELLLTLAMVTLLGALSIPYFMTFQTSSQLDSASQEISQSLRRAKIRAIAAENDDNWGLAVKEQKITIFKGSNYTGRDVSFDEAFDLPSTITASGPLELYFHKLTGTPSTIGNVTLISTNAKQKTITINANGTINFE